MDNINYKNINYNITTYTLLLINILYKYNISSINVFFIIINLVY